MKKVILIFAFSLLIARPVYATVFFELDCHVTSSEWPGAIGQWLHLNFGIDENALNSDFHAFGGWNMTYDPVSPLADLNWWYNTYENGHYFVYKESGTLTPLSSPEIIITNGSVAEIALYWGFFDGIVRLHPGTMSFTGFYEYPCQYTFSGVIDAFVPIPEPGTFTLTLLLLILIGLRKAIPKTRRLN